jgi:multifunctional beta-oxidation protein
MAKVDGFKYDYTKKDVILYNLGLGAKHNDLSLVFEGSPSFEALPSFGTVIS